MGFALKCYEQFAQSVRDIRRALLINAIFPKRQIPKPIEKSILLLYRECRQYAKEWRRAVKIDRVINAGKAVSLDSLPVENLQRYAYIMGEIAALEGVMERCFIDYDTTSSRKR